jgi:hypothetical protein
MSFGETRSAIKCPVKYKIGYDKLGTLANVNWKTAKACLRSLEAKLAIETIGQADPHQQLGRTYRIYSFILILERRRAAGLDWVEKGRGVKFLTTPTTLLNGTVPVSTTVPESGTVPEAGTEAVPETGTGTVPETGTPIYIGIVKEVLKETSSENPSLLAQKLSDLGVPVDDDTAQKIVKRCRNADSTDEWIIAENSSTPLRNIHEDAQAPHPAFRRTLRGLAPCCGPAQAFRRSDGPLADCRSGLRPAIPKRILLFCYDAADLAAFSPIPNFFILYSRAL